MNEPVINPNGRGVSTQSTSTLKDLVFNPETGDFEQVERGTANEGDTVTKMTEDGFASNEGNSSSETLKDPMSHSIIFDPEKGEFIIVPNYEIEEDVIVTPMETTIYF